MSFSRMQSLLKDLERIRDECLGKNELESKKKKVGDGFFGIKEDLTNMLDEIAVQVKERSGLLEQYGRSRQSIELGLKISKNLDIAKERFNKLERQLEKDNNRFIGRLDPEEYENRKKMVAIMASLITDLDAVNNNSRIGAKAVRTNNRLASQAKAEMDEERRKLAEQQRESGKGGKKKKNRRGGGDDEAGQGGDVELPSLSRDEEVFVQQAQQRDEIIDSKLDDVLRGVIQLKEISMTIHEEIQVQGAMINELDQRVSKLSDRFTFANKKMKELLDESGGLTRWCPILIMVIILIALAGYILTALNK